MLHKWRWPKIRFRAATPSPSRNLLPIARPSSTKSAPTRSACTTPPQKTATLSFSPITAANVLTFVRQKNYARRYTAASAIRRRLRKTQRNRAGKARRRSLRNYLPSVAGSAGGRRGLRTRQHSPRFKRQSPAHEFLLNTAAAAIPNSCTACSKASAPEPRLDDDARFEEGYVTLEPALRSPSAAKKKLKVPDCQKLDQDLQFLGTSILAVEVYKISRASLTSRANAPKRTKIASR